MKTSFKAFDPNGNGPVLISDKLRAKIHEEAARLNFPQVDDNALKTFLSKANTNNDGKLTLKGMISLTKKIGFNSLKRGQVDLKH